MIAMIAGRGARAPSLTPVTLAFASCARNSDWALFMFAVAAGVAFAANPRLFSGGWLP